MTINTKGDKHSFLNLETSINYTGLITVDNYILNYQKS